MEKLHPYEDNRNHANILISGDYHKCTSYISIPYAIIDVLTVV